MTLRSKTLAAALAGALLIPAFAFAEDTAAPAADAAKADDKHPPMHKHFEEADADKNGTLSLDEFLARHKKKFDEIDTDKSGGLSPDEMKTYGESRREEWKEHREKMKDMKGDAPADAPAEAPPAQ